MIRLLDVFVHGLCSLPFRGAAPARRQLLRSPPTSFRSRQGAGRPVTAAETSAVTWGGTRLAYAIRRSRRRKKTVAVTVAPDGSVLLVAPEQFPTSRLDALVQRKAPWIAQRRRHVQSHDPPPAPREFVSGESVLYLGRHYRLKCGGDRRRHAARRIGRLVSPARGRAVAGTGGGLAREGRRRAAARRHLRSAETVGELRPHRHHPPELAHHPGPHAAGRLRRGPRAGPPAPPRPRPRLLAGRRPRPARLPTPPRRPPPTRHQPCLVTLIESRSAPPPAPFSSFHGRFVITCQ